MNRGIAWGVAIGCALAALLAPTALAAPGAPSIQSVSHDTVGATTTTLRAEIDPDGYDTTYRFEYGKTLAYGSSAPVAGMDIGAGESYVPVVAVLNELAPGTVYHYRIVATNSQGEAHSEDGTFATFGIETFEASATNSNGTFDTQAGSHPYEVRTEFTLTQDASGSEPITAGAIKDLELHLPPGLAGDSSAVPQCPISMLGGENLNVSNCPPDTQIGLVHLETSQGNKLTAQLYNLVPSSGAPARFGVFVLLFPVVMSATVRPDDSYALTVDLKNLVQLFPWKRLAVTLWGIPADSGHDPWRGKCMNEEGVSSGSCPSSAAPTPFLTLPTSCSAPLTYTLKTNAWSQPGAFAIKSTAEDGVQGQVTPTGCDKLAFKPSIEVQPDTTAADSPTGVSINLGFPQPQGPTGLAEANLSDLLVTLPEGMSINVAAADGLSACMPAQVELETLERPSCPESSKIGRAEILTPLLPKPLTGSIYLAPPGSPFAGALATYIVAEGGGVLVKLVVQLVTDPITGRLTVRLSKAPQLAVTDIKLSFKGGPRAALATPRGCGTFPATSELSPYSAPAAPTRLTSYVAIDSHCGGGFAPSFLAGATSAGAGEGTGFTLRAGRADGEQDIRSLAATLPNGLLAKLGSVPLCGAAQAAAGACNATSRVGTATIAAGAGSHPFYLQGGVFLTGPYGSAPFGLAIALPAVAGPFDLGTVIIRARLLLGRRDARLTIATDPLPRILQGIPLRIQTIAVTVDRPGFMLNPTGCAAQQITGEIAGMQTMAQVSNPFALTGCARLPFSPSVSASTRARVSRGGGASFDLRIGEPRGAHANIAGIRAVFPSQLSARLSAIQQACKRASFDSDPASCPAGSRIGRAEAQTSLLGSPLSGPAYLVSNGTRAPADIAIVLQGEGVTLELLGALKISHGAITVTFATLPDAPISSLDVSLPGGSGSVLGANVLARTSGTLCGKKLVLRTAITGENGLRAKRSSRVSVNGCRRSKAARK
jgi:hypothetical protein